MDAMGELQTIIQTSGFSRAKLAAILREMIPKETEKRPRQHREPASPVTHFTEVKRNYTCLHCEHEFSSIVKLEKGEDTVVLTKEGKCMVINSASPAEVACVTSQCNWCGDFIKRLTREELEERYMLLLSQVSLVGRQSRFGKKITIAFTEVKI
jgi:transcription elongation factor Elf1